jgi:hypothetical protein
MNQLSGMLLLDQGQGLRLAPSAPELLLDRLELHVKVVSVARQAQMVSLLRLMLL